MSLIAKQILKIHYLFKAIFDLLWLFNWYGDTHSCTHTASFLFSLWLPLDPLLLLLNTRLHTNTHVLLSLSGRCFFSCAEEDEAMLVTVSRERHTERWAGGPVASCRQRQCQGNRRGNPKSGIGGSAFLACASVKTGLFPIWRRQLLRSFLLE